jgi:hypothetical protein
VVACGQGQKHPELTSILTSTGVDVPARGRMEDAVRNPEINTQRTAADDPGQQFSGFLNRVSEFVGFKSGKQQGISDISLA